MIDYCQHRRMHTRSGLVPWRQRASAPSTEQLSTVAQTVTEVFEELPFLAWAAANGFPYPPAAVAILSRCESPAEATFVREFVSAPNTAFHGEAAYRDGSELKTQCPLFHHRIDVVLTRGAAKFAIEIDGAFHHASPERISADYLRERRIVYAGYTVIRFTARDALGRPAECWRQVDRIVARRSGPIPEPVRVDAGGISSAEVQGLPLIAVSECRQLNLLTEEFDRARRARAAAGPE